MPINKLLGVGEKYGEWEITENLGNGKVLCKCSCGTIREVYKQALVNGKTKSCGCKKLENKKNSTSLAGQRFGEWEVVGMLGNGETLCRCSCGLERKVKRDALINGKSKSCGCKSKGRDKKNLLNNYSAKGNTYGSLYVLEETGDGKLICKCDCGSLKEYKKEHVISGKITSCGCMGEQGRSNWDLRGMTFGYWHVIDNSNDNKKVVCECICGTKREIRKDILIQGKSKSCGCKSSELCQKTMMDRYGDIASNRTKNPRELWQIDVLGDRDKMIKYIESLGSPPSIVELANKLSISPAFAGKVITNMDIKEMMGSYHRKSKAEDEIYSFIQSINNKGYEIQKNQRGIAGDLELDIYIPELKLAIEFNGTYWHSTLFKDKKYHQKKSILCRNLGIRLVHIFEYEWINEVRRRKIENMLHDIIDASNTKKIYARNTDVKTISSSESADFLNKYHLQGNVNAPIRLGCYYEKELVGVMTFGKYRYGDIYEYELYRLCWKSGVRVIGGAEKILKRFIAEHRPKSIVTYADISKFTGQVYKRLGFVGEKITTPSYVWVRGEEVLSREKTTKSNLLAANIGTKEETEDDIMYNIGYYKIYNSGNLRYEMIFGGE